MPLPVVCYCRYLANRSIFWRPEDFDSYKFVHALKGHQLNKHCFVPVRGTQRKLSNENLEDAVEWFGIFGADRLAKTNIIGNIAVVPIPSSGCTVSSSVRPPARKLARAVCDSFQGARLFDCLRWKQNLGSASKEGGPRDASVLYDNLRLMAKPPAGSRVVLIDDVLTSGGHLRACAARLKIGGAHVDLAICGGRTLYHQERRAFDIVEETLDDYDP
jgi:hypothetical protein